MSTRLWEAVCAGLLTAAGCMSVISLIAVARYLFNEENAAGGFMVISLLAGGLVAVIKYHETKR